MTKLTWSRDGDQWVGKLDLGRHGKMEARITEWGSPLGDQFSVQVRGSGIGSCMGGTQRSALARAKQMAKDRLENEAASYLAGLYLDKPAAKPTRTEPETERNLNYAAKFCGLLR